MSASPASTSAAGRQGQFSYMQSSVQPSLHRNGKVLTRRDRRTLGRNGFELIRQPFAANAMNFLDNQQVVSIYYPHCASVIREQTGAAFVAAFEHNIRSATGKNSKRRIKGGATGTEAGPCGAW